MAAAAKGPYRNRPSVSSRRAAPRSPAARGSASSGPETTAKPDKDQQRPDDNHPTLSLKWPAKLRRTAMREAWHRRLCAVPANLSIRELAERLGDAYPTVSFWAKAFKYPFRRVPRGRKSEVAWDAADWSRKNSEIARDLGVSGERVRQMRQQLKLPPAPRCSAGGIEFRRFVRKNARRLHQWSIREMIARSGADISTATAHVILQQTRHPNGHGSAPKAVVTTVDRHRGRGVVAPDHKRNGRA